MSEPISEASSESALHGLSALLNVEARARAATSAEQLGFVMVNQTLALAHYRQAALWVEGEGIRAVSGVAVIDAGAPYMLWLGKLLPKLAVRLTEAGPVTAAMVDPADREDWAEWLPPHALLLPLIDAEGRRLGALLLARDGDWSEAETALLVHLSGAYAHAWGALHRASPRQQALVWAKTHLTRRRQWAIAAVLLAVLAVPVHLSVLAPGEMVPADPAVVRAPLEGVVDKILVKPNDVVTEGQPLFELDATPLTAKLDVARKAQATAEAEYRQAAQAAVWDPKSKAQMAILAGRIEERQAEADYLQGLLERIRVKAPRGGVAVFDDPSEWIGRPVAIGERVMVVAGEHETEIEAWLAIGDAIDLKPGAELTLFLNVDPLHPVAARLRYAAYEAATRADGTLAYRLRATVDAADKPRVGLKGTARIEGARVPLAYWLLRRPLAAARQFLGL